jgi:hypothetical protein
MTLVVTLLGAGCQGSSAGGNSNSSAAPTSTPSGLTEATSGCPSKDIPVGFQQDTARSGMLAASQYSESGDMQAAMIYDGYQTGFRSVYTNLGPAPGGSTDLVIECDTLQFQASSGVTQFLAAYKALRDEAGSLAVSQTPVASVGTTTLQYLESGQSFAGYNIASTNVLELSTQLGADFDSVVIAGPDPAPQQALTLLRDLVVQP